MRRRISIIVSFTLLLVTSGCLPEENPSAERAAQFKSVPTQQPIEPGIIDEASGIAYSKTMSGYIWTHQDSGNPADLYLVSHDGKTIKNYPVPGAVNIDWEDMTAGPGPREGISYLYIGDIGGNNDVHNPTHTIYRVPEIAHPDQSFDGGSVEKITYHYSDGPRDAETLMLDPDTKDLYIVSKETSVVHLYKLPYPQSTTDDNTAHFVGTIPGIKKDGASPGIYTSPTSGDISMDGKEIIIKNYLSVYYWKRKDQESVSDALLRAPDKTVPYLLEPQGEAICFDKNAGGYFTLSELGGATSVTLNFYKRR